MVLDDILNILENDVELKQLIDGVHAFGSKKKNCIVYDYTELTSDKIKAQARLTLTIITTKNENDFTKNLLIHKRVKQLLLTLGDEKLNNDILEVALNGGGILENDESNTIHNKAIFIVKYKERR